MATLNLVKTDAGKYLLQGAGDPSQTADFSLYYLDGEGGDPHAVAPNAEWAIVEGIPGAAYDPEDSDSFWDAHAQITKAAKHLFVDIPREAAANTTSYHVTSVRNGSIYGHTDDHCDDAGCAAGSEVYIGPEQDDVEAGRVYDFDDDGNAVSEVVEG